MSDTESDEQVDGRSSPEPVQNPTAARPIVEVTVLSVALLVLAAAVTWRIPALDQPQVPAEAWAPWVLSFTFGATLLTVFRIEFRGNAILFSLSEIPLIFALVYLDPLTGLAARLVASAVVFGLIKRPPLHKQLFNLAMFAFETALAYSIVRNMLPMGDVSDARMVLSSTAAVTAAGIFGSIAVALAVSRFVGDTLRHIVDELRAAWVLAVNGAMAGAIASAIPLPRRFPASLLAAGIVTHRAGPEGRGSAITCRASVRGPASRQ